MISNISSNLYSITKRRLLALSHYKFRMKLKILGQKYNTIITETNEFLTSKTCCQCLTIKDDLGASKVYNCNYCHTNIDRDINAAINIYNNYNLLR